MIISLFIQITPLGRFWRQCPRQHPELDGARAHEGAEDTEHHEGQNAEDFQHECDRFQILKS
jgi:hypothetical protein